MKYNEIKQKQIKMKNSKQKEEKEQQKAVETHVDPETQIHTHSNIPKPKCGIHNIYTKDQEG